MKFFKKFIRAITTTERAMNGVLFSFVIAGVSGTAPAVSFDCRHVIGMGEGLQCSDYNATTPDGFILSLQRVTSTTSSRNASTEKNVVLLWHGLIASSMTFMTNLRNQVITLSVCVKDGCPNLRLGLTKVRLHIMKTLKRDQTNGVHV